MCGIAGYCDFTTNLTWNRTLHEERVINMGNTLIHRGPDDGGTYISEHAAFAHRRLAVIDPENGRQPMVRNIEEYEFSIVYNGELYNTEEIRTDLQKKGYTFQTRSDTEVLLMGYIAYGKDITEKLNGIYGFAIWDSRNKSIFLCRDRFGVKPLFYSRQQNQFIFGSEIKALLAHPLVEPIINRYGLSEIFGLGPARSPGVGVYEGIYEIPPAHYAIVDYCGIKIAPYWNLKAEEYGESYEETVTHTRDLLFDAIERQLVSDVPICTLLSGGLDSSLVSAVAANYLRGQGKKLDTYSFDYVDNNENFKASSFQPDEDRPFVDIMANHIQSNHRYLELEHDKVYECLYHAVEAKDLPGMVDVDSSLLAFSQEIKKNHTVCLSGECADEIFGGYPWFRKLEEGGGKENAFPWSENLDFRKSVLSENIVKQLELEEYVRCQYKKTMERVPHMPVESILVRKQKEMSVLNMSWFMATLLERKDRMTMSTGLEVRVPFADHRLIGYLYNVPWKYKYRDNKVKGLLIDVASQILPEEILKRKKCPYPKTYDPKYEELLKVTLKKVLLNGDEPIGELVNRDYLLKLMELPSDYGKPWFGQLMAGPQMYGYLIQVNYWLKKYKVKIQTAS